MVQSRHVNLIDIRPLFAIDLDVDEQLVHHAGGGVVLEAFVCHYVAPVAGCIADREQDRLAALFGFGKRFRSPRPPVDRVVFVLKKIGARFARETI